MNQIQLALITSYGLMTCYFFMNWLKFTLRHPTYTTEEKFLSFVMFLITTVFWPVVILMSLWQIFNKGKLEFITVIPVMLAIFAFSVSYYLSYLYEHGFCYNDISCFFS